MDKVGLPVRDVLDLIIDLQRAMGRLAAKDDQTMLLDLEEHITGLTNSLEESWKKLSSVESASTGTTDTATNTTTKSSDSQDLQELVLPTYPKVVNIVDTGMNISIDADDTVIIQMPSDGAILLESDDKYDLVTRTLVNISSDGYAYIGSRVEL